MKVSFFVGQVLVFGLLQVPAVVGATEPTAEQDEANKKPVEDSISLHMSYLFAPSYRRLKPVMLAEPKDASDWGRMRSEALLLAEGGGSLLRRRSSNAFKPKAKQNWPENSIAVKKHATALYRAAKEKDFAAAKRGYLLMTASCNACHQSEVSIGSPPILTPLGHGITDK
ncbi:hypothetical protein SV7mr_26510 [Stieleria bergensis]|uniref:Cytochrome c domain-containing protein n=1 Tax=Stieleria bergensis TaxID=2528025 RepID=A0A517SVH6_9BACT|nr:hypothetical protein SV7mr_26510 [Planctomycetes bacterium SV_7m_r]